MEVIAQRDQSMGSRPTSGSHAILTTAIGAGVAVLGCVIALTPALRVLGGGPPQFFFNQQGQVQIYLVYIMFMVVLALAWVSLRGWWGTS